MKTSNLILISLATIFAILVLSGYLIIGYKFKHHIYTEASSDNLRYQFTSISRRIVAVKLKNIGQCKIISSDSLRVGIEDSSQVTFSNDGDTLIIVNGTGTNSKVRIYLSDPLVLISDKSNLELVGSPINERLRALSIKLSRSTIVTAPPTNQIRQFFGIVTLLAQDTSVVTFSEKDQVNSLKVNLRTSTLNCRFSTIGSSTITADPSSQIALERFGEIVKISNAN